ncbi:MAG TPA: cob(I)yrinic acid a,c-diamide adenosyltransferase [Candidatus Binatia bacterium]|nr:cob(I)yrinic acid a,c-diamide adenosyltransferase [Candidatus Binatia bacterium]
MAIRITKVYTRTGDRGETALVGGRRVAKDSQRIVAYGAIDELNSVLGIVRALATKESSKGAARLVELLKRLQNELFDLGSELATPPDMAYEGMWRASEAEVLELERTIDECQKSLESLKSFILPGGGPVGAFLHQARTVCRRAEVETLRLSHAEAVSPFVLCYLNRLSDLLFVLARWIAKEQGEPEYLWERGLRLPTKGEKGK